MWLLYALTLTKHDIDDGGNDDDAKRALRLVQRSAFRDRGREFYGALSRAADARTTGWNDDDTNIGRDCGDGRDAREDDADGAASSCRRSLGRGETVADIADRQMRALVEVGLLLPPPPGGGSPSKCTAVGGDAAPAASAPLVAAAAAAPYSSMARTTALGGARLASLPSLGSGRGGRSSSLRPPVGGGAAFGIPSSATAIEEHGAGTTAAASPPVAVATENDNGRSKADDDASATGTTSSVPSFHRGTKRPLTLGSDRPRHSSTAATGAEEEGGSGNNNGPSLLRTRLELRKRLKLTDRTNRRAVPGGGGKGGLRAILSQSVEDDDDGSDDDDDDGGGGGGQVAAKRSADSCASAVTAKRSSGSCASASSSENGTIFHQDISPIDREPTTSVKDMNLDYLLDWDPTKRDAAIINKKRVTISEDASAEKASKKGGASIPKITRNDLAYMMTWNPSEKMEKRDEDSHGGGGGVDGTAGVVVLRSAAPGNNHGKNMSTIDEATEGSALGEVNNQGIASRSRSSVSSQESEEKNASGSRNSRSADISGDNPSRNEDETPREQMISTSKLDRSFLPLIENKNIIRVEDEPYAKLGVIGKGGSCKVYRALSRDCNVVALKKVKLDGLNKLAVDGYANEIALLKRLKGNPAIIQLYSAEVDLARKSILLVMELGEVDLNYVLRQQELSSSRGQGSGPGRSSLNMNFIRLTWQQMLTAVYSIHEERIIHSDLKPAVRK